MSTKMRKLVKIMFSVLFVSKYIYNHVDEEFYRGYIMVFFTNTVINAKMKTKLSQKYGKNEEESMERDLKKGMLQCFKLKCSI